MARLVRCTETVHVTAIVDVFHEGEEYEVDKETAKAYSRYLVDITPKRSKHESGTEGNE